MTCKVCGRTGLRRTTGLQIAVYAGVIEMLCWGCKVWSQTGYVMPERRA